MRGVASMSRSGLSFTWRMNLPVPSNRPSGSASSAPRKNPTLTWALKALTYANAASPTHTVGWPSCNNSRTPKPALRDRPQFTRMLMHPDLDSWISLDRTGEPQKSAHSNFFSMLRHRTELSSTLLPAHALGLKKDSVTLSDQV